MTGGSNFFTGLEEPPQDRASKDGADTASRY
jgi:hypothetical protein